jgi:hypothetical protein
VIGSRQHFGLTAGIGDGRRERLFDVHASILNWSDAFFFDGIVRRMSTSNDPSKTSKNVITGKATILALDPLTGGQDDAAIAGPTFRADNIRLPHAPNMRPESPVCHHFQPLSGRDFGYIRSPVDAPVDVYAVTGWDANKVVRVTDDVFSERAKGLGDIGTTELMPGVYANIGYQGFEIDFDGQ